VIAALYVQTGGAYYGLEDVDPWDEARDARLYAGPWPVVAHPPCNRWGRFAGMIETRHGHARGDDGGCFAAALESVRTFGGVLEHPAHSEAWRKFSLPAPMRGGGWIGALDDPGWSCWVDQGWYGHELAKGTWLYTVGVDVAAFTWGRQRAGGKFPYGETSLSETARKRVTIPTPDAFRDVLLNMARSALPVEVSA
jgi:hypothetical protein